MRLSIKKKKSLEEISVDPKSSLISSTYTYNYNIDVPSQNVIIPHIEEPWEFYETNIPICEECNSFTPNGKTINGEDFPVCLNCKQYIRSLYNHAPLIGGLNKVSEIVTMIYNHYRELDGCYTWEDYEKNEPEPLDLDDI